MHRDNRSWHEKQGVTLGMAMTEKQGGTEVQANTATARALGAAGRWCSRCASPGASTRRQPALLLESGNAIVADAFCAARLGAARGMVYGELPASVDCAAIIARASPAYRRTTWQIISSPAAPVSSAVS